MAGANAPERCPHCGARGVWYGDYTGGYWEPGCIYCGWQDYTRPATATGRERNALAQAIGYRMTEYYTDEEGR